MCLLKPTGQSQKHRVGDIYPPHCHTCPKSIVTVTKPLCEYTAGDATRKTLLRCCSDGVRLTRPATHLPMTTYQATHPPTHLPIHPSKMNSLPSRLRYRQLTSYSDLTMASRVRPAFCTPSCFVNTSPLVSTTRCVSICSRTASSTPSKEAKFPRA